MRTPSEIRRQKLEKFIDSVGESDFVEYTRDYLRESTILALNAADTSYSVEFGALREGYYFLNELCDILDPCKDEATEEIE